MRGEGWVCAQLELPFLAYFFVLQLSTFYSLLFSAAKANQAQRNKDFPSTSQLQRYVCVRASL